MDELASLTLFPATKEQLREARKRNFTRWGNGLHEHQYLAKESHLDMAQHAIDGKLGAW